MKKLVVLLSVVLLSGCVLTEYASDYFKSAVDLNRYAAAKELDDKLCDPDILARLQKTRTEEWYEATVKDCQLRKEKAVRLAN